MAQHFGFVCDCCGHEIESWDDGHPYYLDGNGRKQYAYHPRHDLLALCIGNDTEHICLDCGKEFLSDSAAPAPACPRCCSTRHLDTLTLDNQPCPFCKQGTFRIDSNIRAIS